MYVIRDKNNVLIDLYFLCFTSPTLSLFLSDEGGKKGKLVYFSEQRWMDRGEKFWSVGRWHGSKTNQNIILRWFTISMYFSWCMGVRINYGVVHKLEKQMYWQDSQRKKNSLWKNADRHIYQRNFISGIMVLFFLKLIENVGNEADVKLEYRIKIYL